MSDIQTSYIRLRDALIEAEKEVKWETIAKNDFKASVGDYFLRVEQMDRNSWWWCVWLLNKEIGYGIGVASEGKAKQSAIMAYVDHKLKNES